MAHTAWHSTEVTPRTNIRLLGKDLLQRQHVSAAQESTRQPFRLISVANRKHGRRAAACRPRVEVLEDRVLLAVSAQAQQFVYLLNRARHDPGAYEAEVGLPVGLLDGVQARPPLAVNDQLFASSEFHASEMATFNYFGHQSQVTSDWPNKMARDQGYVLPAFFPDDANYIESLAAGFNTGVNPDPYSTADEPLRALILDEGVNPPGHRIHLLGTDAFNADNREIGVGYAYNASSAYRNYWAIHATRTDPSDTFLTGVTYDDVNGNGRYDLNEGLGNVSIGAGGLTTTTNAMGGWSIAMGAGTYTVTASGGSFTGSSSGQVTVGTDNVEVDFISGDAVPQVDFATIVLPDRLGAHRDHRFFLDVNGSGSWDGAAGGDRLSEFGADGDRPIVGDFNGDGFDEIGVHRGDRFFLDVNGSGDWDGQVGGDALLQFGAVGDTPLVGDFNGNGVDEIGVHRGSTFFLDANGNGQWNGVAGATGSTILGPWATRRWSAISAAMAVTRSACSVAVRSSWMRTVTAAGTG